MSQERYARGILARALLLIAPAALVLPVWLWLEAGFATDLATASARAAAAEAASRIDDVLGRFERATSGLRPADIAGDPAMLSARLIRTDTAIAPARGLLVANSQGRLVASSMPLAGADVAGAWWLAAGLATEPGAVALAGPGEGPLPDGTAYALLRRLPDGNGGGSVVAAFVPAGALLGAAHPATLPPGASLSMAAADPAPRPEPAAGPWTFHARSVSATAAGGALRLAVTPAQDAAEIALRATVARSWPLPLALFLALTLCVALAARRLAGSPAPAAPAAAMPDVAGLRVALREAEARMAEAFAERDRTLAAIGHDVRTPLNSILGIVALLLDGDLEESQRRWLVQVRASCEVLLAMLNGILEATSAIADGRDLALERVAVGEVLAEVVEVFRPMAQDKGLDLSCEVEEGARGSWLADATRLRQVACNLVGNAVKFTDSGAVRVGLGRAADGLCITVEDTGPGISEAERDQIFRRFGRGRAEVTAGRDGVGLGLSLCQEIAGLMGGSLALDSAIGAGTTFRFTFRTEAVDAPRKQRLLRGRTALVVGLSEGLRRQTVELLERLGCLVESAPDGFVGLGLAERVAHEHGMLDLVLLDAALTGLPAEAVLARLGASRALKSARVLLIGGGERSWPSVDATLAHPVEERDLLLALGKLFSADALGEGVEPELAGSATARVLVAEDNSVNRTLLLDVLGKADFTVFGAKDGEEAVQAASRGGFDAVVMDIQMPVLDGIEAIRRIRALPRTAGVPILALTAHSGVRVRRACLDAGATAVLHKPADLGRLVTQLREAIEAARAALREAELKASVAAAAEAAPGVLDPGWLEAFVLEHGWPRARVLLEAMMGERATWIARVEELVAAAEWRPVSRAAADLHARAEEIGAIQLSEALDALAAAAAAVSAPAATAALAALQDAWAVTAPALAERLQALEARRGTRPSAA